MMDIETVARAMAKADGKDPDAPAWVKYPGGYPLGTCWLDQYADKARAAIEAMRYVDGVGEETAIAAGRIIGVDAVLAIECLEAWIDAALDQKS